jgi:serine/threonine-protein kinase
MPQLAKYDVVEEIGHGGMATVYRARDKRLGREVAVKVIHPHLRDSREVVTRFNAEARAVAKLRHPNIVEVFDVSEANEAEQYLVVELVRGTTLRKILEKHGAMPPEIAASLALDLLGALSHANSAGVIHRDIKPENVLIERTAGDVAVKLTDFGIAKLLDAQGVTSTGQVLGSPAHMAPEQIEGGEVDARADVFGLGVLLYECMVGHLPFEGSNPAQVLRRVLDGRYPEAQTERPSIGNRWSAILDRTLAHVAAERFADAGAVREAIATELDRVGFAEPRRELAAWMADPEAYVPRHAERMIERLCTLGGEARSRGDVLGAAGDYNRALAHAPGDPRLLKIVAGMNRAEAVTRALKRAAGALTIMLALGGLTYVVGHALRGRPSLRPAFSAETVLPAPANAASALPEPPPAVTASETNAPARPRATAPPAVAAAKPVERTMTLDLSPSMGVVLSVDDGAPRHVSTGDTLVLDGKAHALSFTCEVCTQVHRDVPAGDKDDTVRIAVPIKPATLLIEGDVDKTYQIEQHPELTVRAGTNVVSLASAYERVTIQQIETKVSVPVRLEAGHSVRAAF